MNFTGFLYYIFRIMRLSLIIVMIFVFISFFIVRPGKVDGKSMEPTYKDREIFLVNKLGYLFFEPDRYDCIQVIKTEKKELLIKRVIGLPNDVIKIENGIVYKLDNRSNWLRLRNEFNGIELNKTFPFNNTGKAKIYYIPDDSYFVLGDNRFHSTDSRHFGFIKRDQVVGKVLPIFHSNI